MARTNVPVVPLTLNSGAVETAGVAIDVANGHTITPGRFNKLIVEILYTVAPASNTIFRAGVLPAPSLEAGLGDVTVTGATGARWVFGPFTGGRFAQAGGALFLDFAATTAGTIWAYEAQKPTNLQ